MEIDEDKVRLGKIDKENSMPLIKKNLFQGVQNLFSKLEMELFHLLPDLRSKTSFTKCFQFLSRISKFIFKTGNGII